MRNHLRNLVIGFGFDKTKISLKKFKDQMLKKDKCTY